MLYNRLDSVRVLNVVKTVEVNEVKFAADGQFGVAAPDGSMLLFGTGLKFGKEVALMDVSVLLSMFEAFKEAEVNVELKDNRLTIGKTDVVFSYRLAAPDLVEGVPLEKRERYLAQPWVEVELLFEEMEKIKELINTLNAETVSFSVEDGRCVVTVGDKKLFYGEFYIQGEVKLEKSYSFLSSKIKNIISMLDDDKVKLAFSVGEKSMLKIQEKEFVWFVGSILVGEQKKSIDNRY